MKISIVLQTYPNENVALQFKLYTLQNLYFKLCRVDCTGRTFFFQKLSIKTKPERYSSLSYHLYIKKFYLISTIRLQNILYFNPYIVLKQTQCNTKWSHSPLELSVSSLCKLLIFQN